MLSWNVFQIFVGPGLQAERGIHPGPRAHGEHVQGPLEDGLRGTVGSLMLTGIMEDDEVRGGKMGGRKPEKEEGMPKSTVSPLSLGMVKGILI